jgi:hypothetical protein
MIPTSSIGQTNMHYHFHLNIPQSGCLIEKRKKEEEEEYIE